MKIITSPDQKILPNHRSPVVCSFSVIIPTPLSHQGEPLPWLLTTLISFAYFNTWYKGNNTICSLLCLASLPNIMFLRFIHIAVIVINYSFIFLHRISLCEYITIYLSILLLMGIWDISILGLLYRVLLWTC